MELKFLTRVKEGKQDPQGKPRVFFSCHPDDFEMAFPLISEDVLEQVNCVIYYDPDLSAEYDPEELEAVLNESQLLVLGITSTFLYEKNPAREVILPLALKDHVPVLPIMLETGLSGEFSNICARIQVVNRYVSDPTATPYVEVLRTFLNSVLISDELAEKVRAAFDAYVFMSYRKKDRRYAQRLMKLIHSNKEYQDIAIWYDEFLVPGEGFNEAIVDAFKKSTLFAMTVTPHLEEKGNYVMLKEYPMARDREIQEKKEVEEKKKKEPSFEIIPVEMYDKEPDKEDWRLDVSKLKDHDEFRYKEILDMKDEHRPVELNQTFINALSRIAKKGNDGSSEHRFFIGLAYLAGIDMEIDQEKALYLITSAATDEKNPCLEATEKLVDMYITGDGVPHDFKEAIRWQELLVDQLKEKYALFHSPDEHLGYGTRCFKALLKLSDLLRDCGDYKGSEGRLQEALALTDSLTEEVGKRDAERDKAVICTRLGGLAMDSADWRAAQEYYRRAEASYDRMAREIGTARARRDLSIAKERLGDVARKSENFPAARELYQEVLKLRRELREASVSSSAKRDLSAILTKLGSVCKAIGDMEAAKGYYNESFEIDRAIALEERTTQAWDDYAVSLTKQGDLLKAEKRYEAAAAFYEEAAKIFGSQAKNSRSIRARRHYAGSLEKLASAGKQFMDRQVVRGYFEEAIRYREKILEESQNPAFAHELAVSCFNYGIFAGDKRLIARARDIWRSLKEARPGSMFDKFIAKAEKMLR